MAHIGKDIQQAAALLLAGELVAIPTETVYGLAANALDEHAVAKIFAAKDRPSHNPLILHVHDLDAASQYVDSFPEAALSLAERFWPGPLTLLLPKKPGSFPDIVNNGLSEVAIRVPRHPLTLSLLRTLRIPLAAPSANPSGYISPTTAAHVAAQLGDRIPYILDGGPCTDGIESTIVRIGGGTPTILRQGAIPMEAIAAILGTIAYTAKEGTQVLAPGMMSSHYAPRTRLLLSDDSQALLAQLPAGRYGAVRLSQPLHGIADDDQVILSPTASLAEAARGLYAALHHLDILGLDAILAERFPTTGLGPALNDRLQRAATLPS